MSVTRINLQERLRNIGSSYDPIDHDTYTGYCDCGEEVTQEMAECPVCGNAIIWYNSRLWKQLHGSPKAAYSKLSRVEANDAAGRYLLSRARLSGFASQGEYDLWLTLSGGRDFKYVKNIVDSTSKWKNGISGRGLVTAVMNRLAKTKQDEPKESGATITWD